MYPVSIPFADALRNNKPYRSALLFFGGFTQKREPDNGIFALADAAYKGHAPECWVQYFPWYVDVDTLARTVESMASDASVYHGEPLRIGVIGYSFGGYTATRFCARIACLIDELVLCDPVARWLHRVGWSRAIIGSAFGWPKIRTTPNVLRLRVVRQRNRRLRLRPPFFFPTGHDVEHWTASKPFKELDAEHVDIESSPEFRLMALDAISRVVSEPRPKAAA